MLENPEEIKSIIYTTIEILKADNLATLAELMGNAEMSSEQTGYDNWDGGIYFYTIYLTIDVVTFIKVRNNIEDTESTLLEKMSIAARHLKKEVISFVKIVPRAKPTNVINEKTEEGNKDENISIEVSTRRNILDAFIVTRISWYGSLEQTNFLSRLFDLSKLSSFDHRYKTAEEDIHKHTVLNNDWTDEWIFTDRRFNLLHTSDKLFLNFLCLTIHPTVRENRDQVVTLLEIYNNNLSNHQYEIVPVGAIAGEPVFGFNLKKEIIQAANSTQHESKFALVIGCSDYEHCGQLANPINDANSFEEKLKKLGFDVIKSINPNQKDLKKAIDEFGEILKGCDVGLFYFAGHGVQVKGINYLLPIDANLKTEKVVEYDCVEVGRVLAYMEESNAQVNIVILDACRDNPFERSWGRGISQRGLTTMNAPSGSLIAYATSPGNTASDGSEGNGLYTHSLLEHIASKQVSIMSMFQNVRKDVLAKSKKEQIPWEATSLTADYFFNP